MYIFIYIYVYVYVYVHFTLQKNEKMKFFIKDFFSKCDQFPADLVTFTDEILNEKFNFLCSVEYC